MKTLSKEQVLRLHNALLETFGGTAGIRDDGLLESALNAPFATFGGQYLYPSVQAKAAQLGFGLVCNHPFVDGNKRITPYSEFRKLSAESGIAFAGGGLGTALVMLTACNSSRTTLRMLSSSLSVCSVARMACTRNSLRLADGTCCSNAHARRCCGSLRFGRKTYCGRFMPRFYGATRRPTHARIRPRSPCRPTGKSSYKGRLWGLGGGSPPMRRRPIARRG